MDAFLGEIRLMGFAFPPRGWMYCQGQMLNIAQNQALFSLLGTTYGGNGQTTFALPDLRGRAIVGVGQGQGLSNYVQGQQGGTENVALVQAQIPPHNHTFAGTIQTGSGVDSRQPNGEWPGPGTQPQFTAGSPNATLNAGSLTGGLSNAGNSQPHENRMPTLVLNYAIAIQGYFPSRP